MSGWVGSGSVGYLEYSGPDVAMAPHAQGGGYLYKKNELLVAQEDLVEVQGLLYEWGVASPPDGQFSREPVTDGSQWVRLTLAAGSPPASELVAKLRGVERSGLHRAPYRVSPNHVLRGNGHASLGTASPPEPARDPLGPPPPGTPGADRPVRVVVLDTGELYKHPWLDGRVSRLVSWGTDAFDDEDDLPDPLLRYTGHGTFVAGLVLQHAPRATVLVDRVLDDYGEATDTDLAEALGRVPADVDIVHVSCAGLTHDNIGLPATHEALVALWTRNPKMQVIAPAGNGSTDIPSFPGAFKGVIAVAALGEQPTKAGFSNHGPWVDVCAPGVRAKSTFLRYVGRLEQTYSLPGLPAPEHVGEVRQFDDWAYWSGTCFAAARITGAIAETVGRTGLDAAQAAFQVFGGGRLRLNDNGFDLGVPVFPPSWT